MKTGSGGRRLILSLHSRYRIGPFMRRRALLILASMMLGVLMLGGVALAKEITGASGSDDLEGTSRANKIWGLQGPDYIAGEPGSDHLYGGRGKDEVRGALCWV